jgi:outer membrane protein TolC
MKMHAAVSRRGGADITPSCGEPLRAIALHRAALVLRCVWRCCLGLFFLWISTTPSHAQLSFTSAITLAVQNSPRVKMAQDDVHRAIAVLSDAKDQFIPSATANGGLGKAYGITLSVPTILTLNTQSLVYNAAQRNYIRSAKDAIQAANQALADVRGQVEEDTANAYLSLEAAEQRHAALDEEHGFATKLVSIVQDRLGAGLESDLDLKQAQRTELQIRLQELTVDDEIESLREQLAQLIGLPSPGLAISPESIPPDSSFATAAKAPAPRVESASLLSLEDNARARQEQALGDSRYALRPQLLFQAQYGRISPIDDVSQYYNLHGDYNTFEGGVVIVFPFFDKSHAAKARETMADAMHTQHEAENLRSQQIENRLGLQHSVLELAVKSSLAEVDLGIAQDQLATMLAEVQSHNADVTGRAMTAKDEQNARLQERAKFVDLLDAAGQLRKAQISLMRQGNTLDDWLASLPKL